MSKIVLTAIAVLTFCVSTAQARTHMHRYHMHHHFGKYLAHRHFVHVKQHLKKHFVRRYRHRDPAYSFASRISSLSPACQRARAMGGPCGCVAEEHVFQRNDHVLFGMNLWLAREWLQFPRALAEAGMAAVWGTRHVEAIIANNHDGTIVTDGPYGKRRVRLASVVVVDPHRGKIVPKHRATYQVASAWPL